MDRDKSFERKVLKFGMLASLLVAMVVLMGSALAQPPVDLKGFRFTAAGTPLTTADVDLNFLQFGKGPCCAFTIVNDNAGGGADVLFAVGNGITTAAAGADGSTGSASIPVKAGESAQFDGRFTHCVVRASTGTTTACRIIPSFDK